MTKVKQNNRKEKVVKKTSLSYKIKFALQMIVFLILLSITIGIFYFYNVYGKIIFDLQADAKKIVKASTIDSFKSAQTSLVYDTSGEIISTLKAEKDVYYIEYNDIPQDVMNAIVVTEDRKFLDHDGVDYAANIRAAIELIKNKGEIKQGASTITQQLARNVFLSHVVTYERKIEEIFIAQELEKKYSKYQIMEFYLNNIYFANGYYGIQAASYGYFGKSITSLSLSQLTFLCSIPNNPNLYNPITDFENTLKRRDRVLLQLLEDSKIDLLDYRKAIREEIELVIQKPKKNNYVETYVYHSAIRALMKKQGFQFEILFASDQEKKAYEDAYYEMYYRIQQSLFRAGYRIYTSIDLKKQELLQEAVDQSLKKFQDVSKDGVFLLQGAAVCIDNDNGRVVAIVGGRSQDLPGYTLNRGFQSFRQPGSSIKPLIVYAPSFERGYIPESIVLDEKFEGGPSNASRTYSGEITLQRAIEQSKNTIAWKLLQELTPKIGISYLYKMNFSKVSSKDYNLSSSLGGFTYGVSPLEMASGFSTLENDGYYREPTCIVKIMDSEGNEIVGDMMEQKLVYQSKAAKIMTEALVGVIKNGTGKGLGLKYTISAGKTGTTNQKKDGWFVGYTPYYTTSVWVGYDMPKTLQDLAGATYPGTIWKNYMNQIHDQTMTENFVFYNWREEIKSKEAKDSNTKDKSATKDKEEKETSKNNQTDTQIDNPKDKKSKKEKGLENNKTSKTAKGNDKNDNMDEDDINQDLEEEHMEEEEDTEEEELEENLEVELENDQEVDPEEGVDAFITSENKLFTQPGI